MSAKFVFCGFNIDIFEKYVIDGKLRKSESGNLVQYNYSDYNLEFDSTSLFSNINEALSETQASNILYMIKDFI